MKDTDYWKESLSIAADECELQMTPEQLEYMASAMSGSHEHYGLAFYEPPPSERLNQIEREWERRLADLKKRHDVYITNAEAAVKRALRLSNDANISIGDDGSVTSWGGRIERIL